MNIQYRSMVLDDFEACLDLWKASEGICLRKDDSRESMEAYLARNSGLSQVACLGDRLVGVVLCGHDGRRGFLHHLAVSREYRRKGIATSLVTRVIEALGAAGIDKCHIFVLNNNADGMAFWKKSGWIKRDDIELMSMDVMRRR